MRPCFVFGRASVSVCVFVVFVFIFTNFFCYIIVLKLLLRASITITTTTITTLWLTPVVTTTATICRFRLGTRRLWDLKTYRRLFLSSRRVNQSFPPVLELSEELSHHR